ncbi:hypothetical protein ANCDUO_27736, partial [Ancylostoma duodenale]
IKSASVEEHDEGEAHEDEEEGSEKQKPPNAKRLPLSINAGILLVFCMMGGVTYIAAALIIPGVAVLSMCAELAALELKDIFLKIHYFGRKIKFKRKHKKEQIEVEVKELLKIIEEIRRRYPDKERITSQDILRVNF